MRTDVLMFLALLALVTVGATIMAQAGLVSVSFVKLLGKTLCLCLAALAMDLIWGYTGILSLGHFAFFGIGGYAIGMWLMWDRTELIVMDTLLRAELPPTALEIEEAIGTQIFGVVGSSDIPWLWTFAGSLPLQ
ncbi:MAG: urea ABC transporter permease subunit UrtC, partial [Boseongicola sp.]|nr:urea ABC transporter permease subunit UrtC [Boseongicola sp.]